MERLSEIINGYIASGGSGQALKDTSGNTLSYTGLEALVKEYTEQISSQLPAGKKNVIAIVSERNILLPVVLYAIINTGSAYVPVDHRFPEERVKAILAEASPNAAVVENKYRQTFEKSFAGLVKASVALNEEHTLILLDQQPANIPDDTVYILYTSGSTGTPKGVIHTHSSVISFLQWCNEAILCTEGSNFISISPLQFDLSVFDMFFALFRHGTLLLVKESELANHRMLAQIIAEYKINCVYATPSFFQLLCNGGKLHNYNFDHISHLLLAGEQLHWALLHEMKPYFGKAKCYNLYGPTETNVCCYYEAKPGEEERNPVIVPIGRPCSNAKIHLEVYDDPELPELWVASGTLMHGYVAADASFRVFEGLRYYNTGDIVKLGAGGNLVFCGRRDRMIKKNGFRIEPAEIEKYIKELEGVSQAIALPVHIENSTKLVIFIQSGKAYSLLEIKQYCLQKLPYYMVPDDVVMVDELPVNFNNKTDAQQLIDKYVK